MGRKKNKKNKTDKGGAYFSEIDFPKEGQQQKVRATTPEKAAKKLFKMFKRRYAEMGYIKIYSDSTSGDECEEWVFNPMAWTDNTGLKFLSKPKSKNNII